MKYTSKKSQNTEGLFNDYKTLLDEGLNSIDINVFKRVMKLVESTIKKDKKIFTCGNGGSSSIADHFVCDFVKGSATNTSISPKLYSLSSNMPIVSAIANDYDYKDIFSYQLNKYGSRNDLLIAISSSGESKNIINVLKKAKEKHIKTISLVGFNGGMAKKISDLSLHVKISNYGVVEDIHQSLMHMLAQFIRYNNLSGLSSKKVKF